MSERLARLAAVADKPRSAFDEDPFLRDVVERNFEVVAQCCIDIAQRLISIEQAKKPSDYYEAILRLGELGILPAEFARAFAPIAGFRNVLVHEYAGINWDQVFARLQDLDDLHQFRAAITGYLKKSL